MNDINGLWLINDGMQTIVALWELQQAFDKGSLDKEIPQNIADVWNMGLEVDTRSYRPAYSRDTHVAWMTLLHDSDQNKYRATSVYQKIQVIERYVKKVAGGDLKLVACSLVLLAFFVLASQRADFMQ